jgi:ABC-type uncharacterized transport system permease subunit
MMGALLFFMGLLSGLLISPHVPGWLPVVVLMAMVLCAVRVRINEESDN